MKEPTPHDIRSAVTTYVDALREVEQETYDEIRCRTMRHRPRGRCPEIVVLSCGYAEVWSDGEVTTRGRVWFKVDEDGLVE